VLLQYDREELYEKVWARPLIRVAHEYGVSPVALGKTCRKLQVPVPGRGYWAKKAYGHPVECTTLPKVNEVRRIRRNERSAITTARPSPPSKPEFPVEEEDKIEIARIDQLLSGGAFVVNKPRKALHHPLIVAARNVLGRGFAPRSIVEAPRNELCLDISVSKARLSRALRVMAAIIAILEGDGMKVRVTAGDRSRGDRPRETSAAIFGEKIQFGITEVVRQVRVPEPTATPNASGRRRYSIHHEATGELSIQLFSHSKYFTTTWRDTDEMKVESLTPQCVASMMKIAVEYRRNTAKRRQEEFFRKLQWEELKQLKTQIEVEEVRVQRLENGAINWHRAKQIREYVLAVAECRKSQGKELGPDTALGRWVAWALQQADRIDPLEESPASVLDRKRELEGWLPYGWR
jgi:hypothetical protein